MTKHMDDFLDIPHEDELEELDDNKTVVESTPTSLPIISSDDAHAKETDVIRDRALDLQEEIAEVARNVEPARSARMFEVSGQHLKIALDAANAKEKSKLEAAKLKLDAARLKVDDETVNSLNSGNEVMADRNTLIKQLLAEEEGKVVDVEAEDIVDDDK